MARKKTKNVENNNEVISEEDLKLIQDAQQNKSKAEESFENVKGIVHMANLELDNTILKLYMKYGLSLEKDVIFADGKIGKDHPSAPGNQKKKEDSKANEG